MRDNCSNKSFVYDLIKALAVLSVLMFHTLNIYTDYGTFTPSVSSSILGNLAECVHLINMPLFMASAGCVFGCCLENGKYKKNSELIIKKVKRLLVPNFFFGCFLIAPVMIFCGITDMGYWDYVVDGILLATNSRHLWYLFALFWIFCIGAILKPLCRKRIPWFMLISLALFIICNTFDLPNFLQLKNALIYQFYFFIGVFINNYYDKFMPVLQKLSIPILIAVPVLFWFAPGFEVLFEYKMLWALLGILFFVILCNFLADYCPSVSNNIFYLMLKTNGFGVYLFHPVILYLLYFQLVQFPINPYALSIMAFCTAFLLSVLFTELFRKLHLGFLMGESNKKKKKKQTA